MFRLAVDAMGGDHAPSAIVDGAVAAARHLDVQISLTGVPSAIEEALSGHPDWRHLRLAIVDAPDVIDMSEAPAAALRRKPRASIRVAADLVARHEAEALFSAGHTGATVMAAHAAFGMVTREAHQLLKAAPINFIGNVEGRAIYSGVADVIVCDGFTGNVVLKTSERLVDTVEAFLGDELQGTFSSQVGYLLSRRAFRRFRRRVDYSEYGGAPLLGVAGLAIVGHGRSSAKAVRNAIAMAYRFATGDFLHRVEREIAGATVSHH